MGLDKLLETRAKQAEHKPTFLRRTTTWVLQVPYVRQVVAATGTTVDFLRHQPGVARLVDATSRALDSPLVRRAVGCAGTVTLRQVALFMGCAAFFYLWGVTVIFHATWQAYETYLYHNIEMFVDREAMDDPKVVTFLKGRYLVVPPPGPTPGSRDLADDGWFESSRAYDFLKNQSGGFYIEYPAGDGETASNTLVLETRQNWTGLLIEPNPEKFELLRAKGRRAFLSQSCLSSHPYPEVVWHPVVTERRSFSQWWFKEPPTQTVYRTSVQVQCFPLYTFQRALLPGRGRVDFLSLDADGQELEVLQNIPWTHVDIRVVSVKQYFYFSPGKTEVLKAHQVPSNKNVLVKFLQRQGYKPYEDTSLFAPISTTTTIFVKN